MNNQQHPNQFDDLAKLYYDRLLAQNGRAVKGNRLDRKPTLFDDIPIEGNPRPQAMTLEQQRAIALARARRRREGEAKQGRRPTLFDDLIPQQATQPKRGNLFDDLIPQARKPSLYDDIVPQGRRPTLFDDLPMEGSQQAEPRLLGSIATGAVSGLTLGFDDEIAAGLNTGFGFAGDYSQELERQRAIQGQYRDANPWTAGAGEIGGALATAPLAGGLNVMRGTGLAAGVANSALTGAGYGAAYGAGTSEGDLADRGVGALWGGGLGAIGGAVVPGVIAGARGIGSTMRNAFGGPKGVAARRLAKALETSGKTVDDVQTDIARARAGGAEGYAAVDSLGKPGQKLLRAANTVSEEAAERNATVFGERMAGQGDRIMRQLQGRLGEADDFFNVVDDLAARTRRDAGPLYDQAYRELPTLSTRLKDVLSRPTMKQAIKRGMAMASDEGEKLPLVIDDLGNIQSHRLSRKPTAWVPPRRCATRWPAWAISTMP